MNFSEFKNRLGAEPLAQDPEMLAARASGAEFEEAAREAEAFEHKLDGALNFDVDTDDLLPGLLDIPNRPARRSWRGLAMAASLAAAVLLGVFALQQARQPDTLEAYISSHFRLDGNDVLQRIDGEADRELVERLMARFDVVAGAELAGKIDFIKLCPTPDGEGAHMVMSAANGDVTVIYMPNTRITESKLLRFDDMEARVFALSTGSAAVVARVGQATGDVQALLQSGLKSIGDA